MMPDHSNQSSDSSPNDADENAATVAPINLLSTEGSSLTAPRAELLRRLRAILSGRDLGNGTPLADAAFDAIRFEADAVGIPDRWLTDLTDDALLATAEVVQSHLNGDPYSSKKLIFGTEPKNIRGLDIGSDLYCADASRPGLYRWESLSDDPCGPNAERLLRLIQQSLENRKHARFRDPKIIEYTSGQRGPVVQFAPFPPAGGIILQHRLSVHVFPKFCSWMKHHLDDFVRELGYTLNRLVYSSEELATEVVQIENAWHAAYQSISDERSVIQFEGIAIDYAYDSEGNVDEPCLFVEHSGLDHKLLPTQFSEPVQKGDKINVSYFSASLQDQERRARRKQLIDTLPGFRLIDSLAYAVINFACDDNASIFQKILRSDHVDFRLFDRRDGPECSLYWSSGEINACIKGEGYKLCYGYFSTSFEIPASILSSCVGRSLGSIFEFPFPVDVVITKFREDEDGVKYFFLDGSTHLLDLRDHTIVGEPVRI